MSSLTDAITAVETAQTSYANAQQTTANDTASAAAIQAKLDAANVTVTSDQAAQQTAAASFNQSLSDLIAAANAAMIPTQPAAPPTPATS